MKRSIYVVDDQAGVLDTMVLVLSCADREWVVRGFQDPLQALDAVKVNPPDLIVSDQLMPGMQGSRLLEEVRAISPSTVRVIMSGYVALNKLTLITSAHQYLAKPFDSAHLRQLIQRSFAARDRIMDGGLQNVITGLKSIPSLQQVHQSLLLELEDNRHASTSVGRLVAADAGLSVKVLQLANSPLFGQGELITNPVDAVICLGTDLVAALVFSQTLFRHYENLSHADVDVERIWSHCWEMAYLAQQLCREKGLGRKAGEEVFLAGLLHESGRLILSDNFPVQFHGACEAARQAKSPLAPRLREIFQAGAPQVTGWLLELWGLPVNVINAIAALDKPEAPPGGPFSVPAALYVADRLASRKSPPDNFVAEDLDPVYLRAVGCVDDIAGWEKLPLMEQPGAAK
jgi:HD-like signal output (HDOD) protein